MTAYANASPSDPIALHPRAVYRVVVERAGWKIVSPYDWATGALRWRQVVEGVIDRSASPAGFPLGGGLDNVTNEDTTAVLDYRAGSHPGTLVVSDLVRAIEDATPYAGVVSITRRAPVPSLSEGGAGALAAERDAAQDTARDVAESESFAARITGALKGTRTVFVAGAVIALVVLAVIYLPKPRT